MPNGKVLYFNDKLNMGIVSIDGSKDTALMKDLTFTPELGDIVSFHLDNKSGETKLEAIDVKLLSNYL